MYDPTRMAPANSEPNDEGYLALVLSGGGARAAYQVGALDGIAQRAGAGLHFPIVTGVSAGAINAACLASSATLGSAVSVLQQAWLGMSVNSVFQTGAFSLLLSVLKWGAMMFTAGRTPGFDVRGILDTRPLRRTLSRYIETANIENNLASGRLRALGLSTTSYSTGKTVTFIGSAEDLASWKRADRMSVRSAITVDHVLASSALPLVFPAIAIGDQYFGDGSVRQTAPLAPAIHMGAARLLVLAIRYGRRGEENVDNRISGYPPAAQVLGMLMNSVFLDAVDADVERAERVNRSLALLPGGRAHPEGLRPLTLVVLRPSKDLGMLAADLGHHLPGALRHIFRGLGSSGLQSQDLLSYLLFESPYIERLIELGRADALAQWDSIAPLLDTARELA